MHIFDLLKHGARLEKIAIVTSSALPKSIMRFAVWLTIFHVFKKIGSLVPHKSQSSVGHRFLDGLKNLAYVVLRLCWPDQQMGVFGHNDIGPNMKGQLFFGSVDCTMPPGALRTRRGMGKV